MGIKWTSILYYNMSHKLRDHPVFIGGGLGEFMILLINLPTQFEKIVMVQFYKKVSQIKLSNICNICVITQS